MIPETAVEAAARALYRYEYQNFTQDELMFALKQARLALEAAAPYMLARAWDEGREADDFEVSIGMDGNPYRPTP